MADMWKSRELQEGANNYAAKELSYSIRKDRSAGIVSQLAYGLSKGIKSLDMTPTQSPCCARAPIPTGEFLLPATRC